MSSAAPPPPRKTRGELIKDIDADYYGYRDEDDGVICPLEQEAEKKGGYNDNIIDQHSGKTGIYLCASCVVPDKPVHSAQANQGLHFPLMWYFSFKGSHF